MGMSSAVLCLGRIRNNTYDIMQLDGCESYLCLSSSSHSDIINGINELWSSSFGLFGHHEKAGKGKKAEIKSSHFRLNLNQVTRTALGH